MNDNQETASDYDDDWQLWKTVIVTLAVFLGILLLLGIGAYFYLWKFFRQNNNNNNTHLFYYDDRRGGDGLVEPHHLEIVATTATTATTATANSNQQVEDLLRGRRRHECQPKLTRKRLDMFGTSFYQRSSTSSKKHHEMVERKLDNNDDDDIGESVRVNDDTPRNRNSSSSSSSCCGNIIVNSSSIPEKDESMNGKEKGESVNGKEKDESVNGKDVVILMNAETLTEVLPETDSSSKPLHCDNSISEDLSSIYSMSLGGDGCAICLETYRNGDKLRNLPCNHSFHVDCIDHWLLKKASYCPLCKLDLRNNGGASCASSISLSGDFSVD